MLPNSSTFVIKDLLRSKKLESKLLILLKRIYLARYKQGQWRRKWVLHSISWLPLQIEYMQSWKLFLNIQSFSWLQDKRNLLRSFISWALWILKTQLRSCLEKFSINFINIARDVKLWVLRSSLFHSLITEKRVFKEFLKTLFGTMKRETLLLSQLRVTYLFESFCETWLNK